MQEDTPGSSTERCEIDYTNDEKKEFKLAACFSQKLPFNSVHLAVEEPTNIIPEEGSQAQGANN